MLTCWNLNVQIKSSFRRNAHVEQLYSNGIQIVCCPLTRTQMCGGGEVKSQHVIKWSLEKRISPRLFCWRQLNNLLVLGDNTRNLRIFLWGNLVRLSSNICSVSLQTFHTLAFYYLPLHSRMKVLSFFSKIILSSALWSWNPEIPSICCTQSTVTWAHMGTRHFLGLCGLVWVCASWPL